ncbi:MAG: hypothetical protein GXO29_03215 [Thermotogae bacterium]|nr:hypothetical protein [Thermotogota bacterium]
MNIFVAILMVSASISLLAIAGAVWYLVIRISSTLDRMTLSMERIADEAEDTFKKINHLAERIDSTLTPIERMVQSLTLLGMMPKLAGFLIGRIGRRKR